MSTRNVNTLTNMFPQTKRRNAAQGGRPKAKRARQALQAINPNSTANKAAKAKKPNTRAAARAAAQAAAQARAQRAAASTTASQSVDVCVDEDEVDVEIVENEGAEGVATVADAVESAAPQQAAQPQADAATLATRTRVKARASASAAAAAADRKAKKGHTSGAGAGAGTDTEPAGADADNDANADVGGVTLAMATLFLEQLQRHGKSRPRRTDSAKEGESKAGARYNTRTREKQEAEREAAERTAAARRLVAVANQLAEPNDPEEAAQAAMLRARAPRDASAAGAAGAGAAAPAPTALSLKQRCAVAREKDWKASAPLPPGIRDVYSKHRPAARYCAEFIEDIHDNLMKLERKHAVDPRYMARQSDISHEMRAIMVDWLVEVGVEYHLAPLTLHIGVKLIDRYLKNVDVPRNSLQLVGCACMLIASKLEEISAPTVDEFERICDATYTHDEIVHMESRILRRLDFNVTVCTAFHFLKRFLLAGDAETLEILLAHYLCELTLQEYKMLEFPPSMIASAAVLLSRMTLLDDPRSSYLRTEPAWTANHVHYTGYHRADFVRCIKQLHRIHVRSPHSRLQAVRTKYAHSPYMSVGTIVPLPEATVFDKWPDTEETSVDL